MDEGRETRTNMDAGDNRDRPLDDDRRMPEQAAEARMVTDTRQDELAPLFESAATEQFRTRWLAVQSRFVDDPSEAVKQADDLVAEVIQSITRNFADRRTALEQGWTGGGEASTEDLRLALKQYRSFFERLLSLQS